MPLQQPSNGTCLFRRLRRDFSRFTAFFVGAFMVFCLSGCTSPQPNKGTLLYQAAVRNDTNLIQRLIAEGADPKASVKANYAYLGYFQSGVTESAVHGAARARQVEALKMLLKHNGTTPVPNALFALQRYEYSPLDASVMDIEPPGPITDTLIEAGYRPRDIGSAKLKDKNLFDVLSVAGSLWALASYQERNGQAGEAAGNYERAAELYAFSSNRIFPLAKRQEWARSPVVRTIMDAVAMDASSVAFKTGNYGQSFIIEYYRLLGENPQLYPNSSTANSTAFDKVVYPFALPKIRNEDGKEVPVTLKRGDPPPSLDDLEKRRTDQPPSNFREYALRAALFCRHCAEKARTLRQ
jgi:hypothetical protein